MRKVLILGGGFAGVEAAIMLRKYNFDVTLVSNRDYFYIYPISIWVPTGEKSFNDVSISLKKLQEIHKFELIIDEVTSIKSLEKTVYCKNHQFKYEYLVVAIGSDKMKHKGLENTVSICGKPEDSLLIKEKIDELIKKGSGSISMGFGGNPKDASNVRGGPAYELLFNIHNKLKKLGIRDKFKLNFFAPMKKPGSRMGPKALKMMDFYFKKLNIDSFTGKKIDRFEKDGIVFEDKSVLKSDFTMFIPAGTGHSVFENSDLPLNATGLVNINNYCEVKHDYYDSPNEYKVFAIGDCTALQGADWRAKQGHIAEVMAKIVAFNINSMEKKKVERKGYSCHLNILCIMDSGNGASFVYRDDTKAIMFPMPIFGHWLKKSWGWYCKNSKLKKIPRIPGL